MDDTTRALFKSWLSEMQAEAEKIDADLLASKAVLSEAEAEIRRESVRIGALSAATAKLPKGTELANALRTRLAAASKPSLATATRGHAERIAELQFRRSDLAQAITQVEAILKPPAPLALVTQTAERQVDSYDPIILPAGVAA
jgi:chromosome segregation ATPase